jgi:hypothetical protein
VFRREYRPPSNLWVQIKSKGGYLINGGHMKKLVGISLFIFSLSSLAEPLDCIQMVKEKFSLKPGGSAAFQGHSPTQKPCTFSITYIESISGLTEQPYRGLRFIMDPHDDAMILHQLEDDSNGLDSYVISSCGPSTKEMEITYQVISPYGPRADRSYSIKFKFDNEKLASAFVKENVGNDALECRF